MSGTNLSMTRNLDVQKLYILILKELIEDDPLVQHLLSINNVYKYVQHKPYI